MGWGGNPRKLEKSKEENIKDCKHCTGINLLNSGYKIYDNIIKSWLYTYYKNKLGEEKTNSEKDDLVVMAIIHLNLWF